VRIVRTVYSKHMVIAVVAKKGGVGKSLVSLLLYQSLKQAGRSVELHDWDAQGTATKSRDLTDPGKGIQAQGQAAADVVIYDTPPNLTHTATDTAMRSADLVLVVATPSPVDVWEAQEAAQTAKTLAKKKAKVRVIFNKVKRNTVLGRVLDETAKSLPVPLLPKNLSYREAYQHFAWQGWKALDGTAREEVLQMTIAVLGS
jgi:chromosome partitioning protein